MKNYLRALSFLTVIPLPFVPFSGDGRELSQSAAAFPLAGLTLGLLYAGSGRALLSILPPSTTAVIVLALAFLLTRGLHYDGLADTADGLIGTTGRDKAFRAMDDSAVGVMGASALVFTILLKLSLLSSLAPPLFSGALLFMPLAGRWAIVTGGAFFPPARERGLGDMFLKGLSIAVLVRASVGALAAIAAFSALYPYYLLPLVAGCLGALAGGYLLSLYAAARLGGISGDILGAVSELGELLFLLCFYCVYSIAV